MTNGEKYKNAQERIKAFDNYCNTHNCEECLFVKGCEGHLSAFRWLELEAEEEQPLPCPFCGDSCYSTKRELGGFVVSCSNGGCNYCSGEHDTDNDAIAAHNKVAKAVKESEDKPVRYPPEATIALC